MLLHDGQELDNDLGTGSNQDLTLASLLGIVDCVQAIVQNGGSHVVGLWRSDAIEILSGNGLLQKRYLEGVSEKENVSRGLADGFFHRLFLN